MEQDEASETQHSEEICVLCKRSMAGTETVTLGLIGVQHMLEISLVRKDGLSNYFKNKETCTLHKHCNKKYKRRDSKGIYKPVDFSQDRDVNWMIRSTFKPKPKKKPQRQSYNNEPVGLYKSLLHTIDSVSCDNDTFDYKHNCCLCTECTGPQRKCKSKQWVTLTKDTTKQTIVKALYGDAENPINQQILRRIEHVDLVAKEAVYHLQCYMNVRRNADKRKREREQKQQGGRIYAMMSISSAMQTIYDYVEKSEEIQFSIPQLRDMATDLDLDYVPDERTILRNLQDKYQDRLIVVNIPGTGNVITFFEEDIVNWCMNH